MAVSTLANGQEILTVDDAVSIALKNNFGILVARNDADIAKANNTPGNAGMLPVVQATGSGSYALNNVDQHLSTGIINKYPSLSAASASAGTQLSWKLFDGGKMFVTKNKLNEIESLGEIQFKDNVLQTLYTVISAYYDVVRQKQQLNSIDEVMNYNQEQVKIAQAGFTAGSLLKTNLLQAKIDLNVTMENAVNQQFIIEEAKRHLLELLGQGIDKNFDVTDTIPLNFSPDKNELIKKVDSANTTLQSFHKQMDIARLVLKENSKLFFPVLNFTSGYYFSQSNNSNGSILNNRSFGPQLGGSLTIPIYSAGENQRKINTAKIQLKTAEYDFQNVELQVKTDLQNAISGFENQQKLLKIEVENKELTRENLQISLQRLRLGQTTSLEVHMAQENYMLSCTRLINFEYSLKISETKLKQLIATL